MEKKIYKEITADDLKNDIDMWDVAESLFRIGLDLLLK